MCGGNVLTKNGTLFKCYRQVKREISAAEPKYKWRMRSARRHRLLASCDAGLTSFIAFMQVIFYPRDIFLQSLLKVKVGGYTGIAASAFRCSL